VPNPPLLVEKNSLVNLSEKVLSEKVLDKWVVYVKVSHIGTSVSYYETALHAGLVGPHSPTIGHDLI
jgi:hypothetical protein